MRPVWPRWLRKRGYRCTRRDCQVCKYGWPVDGEPLSTQDEITLGALATLKPVPEPVYRRQP